jgi:hypothetical protein
MTLNTVKIMENEQMQSSLQTKRTHYETLESLLMEISPRYGECFAQNLHRRLLAVQSERNALDDELQTQ